ncbi:MAG: glutathione S-transferase N-terminal domain-containing protein [Patescibacteria group bacterium]|nr:glutathione S-transferase N-terminal domain-containing protein [Patescibacteria group bacterium]
MANVTVYSTTTCPYCVMAKQYLTQRGVPFNDVNVEADEQAAMAMVKKSGQMGVPVIEIDDQIVIGFNRPAIDHLLQLK